MSEKRILHLGDVVPASEEKSSRQLVAIEKVLAHFHLDAATLEKWITKGLIRPVYVEQPDGQTKEWCGFTADELIVLSAVVAESRKPDHLDLANAAGDARSKLAELPCMATTAAHDHQAAFRRDALAALVPLLELAEGDARTIGNARAKKYAQAGIDQWDAHQRQQAVYEAGRREARVAALKTELKTLEEAGSSYPFGNAATIPAEKPGLLQRAKKAAGIQK
jgi:hypothetical protein